MTALNKEIKYLYISPDGDDNAKGGANCPFATISHARDIVRALPRDLYEKIEIIIRQGKYYLVEPLVFTSIDSGTDECPIIYRSQDGEHVELSGAFHVKSDWTPYKNGIWSCDIPELTGCHVGQLFINGKRQILARYPNVDNTNPGKSGYILPKGAIPSDSPSPVEEDDSDMVYSGVPPRGIIYDELSFTDKNWSRPEEAVIHIFQAMYWGSMQFRLAYRDDKTNMLWFGDGGAQIGAKWHPDPCKVNNGSRYFVENVFEELDAPGEWYFDKSTGKMYLMPEDSVVLSNACIEIPCHQQLVRFIGTQKNPVKNITLKGLYFARSQETFMEKYDIPSLGDWAIHRGGAVFLENTRHISIEENIFDAMGGNAIFVNGYNRDARIIGNHIYQAGESAVCLVGDQQTTVGNQRNFPYECHVNHNTIHDCGVFGKQTAGVFISVAKRIHVEHNEIFRMPRAGICINDGTWGGHYIAYNHIFDTCRETGDHGPFNAWGRDRYWCLLHSHGPAGNDSVCHQAGNIFVDQMETVIVRNNFFKETRSWGLDLDDGASNYHILENLCVGVSMKLREGAYRLIENNIWINGANSPCFHVGNVNNHDRYIRNITVMNTKNAIPENDLNFEMGAHYGEFYTLIKPPEQGPWMEELDYNLFYNDLGAFSARVITKERGQGQRKKMNMDEWRAMGFDQHSVYADPCFKDQENDDYTLNENSPALALGFKNIDFRSFGPEEKYRRCER